MTPVFKADLGDYKLLVYEESPERFSGQGYGISDTFMVNLGNEKGCYCHNINCRSCPIYRPCADRQILPDLGRRFPQLVAEYPEYFI
jgi:hypothetical protein